ncbi:MAG: membrane protein insertion efficiency factor YidD [Deltaproteobacteria bacterium]|nr:membrane protein insertion efficiency factor YidD [Deltaproteobacteria bacterium]
MIHSIAAVGVIALKGGILFYRGAISPLLGPTCRFSPSCSAYALSAVQRYGFIKGSWLSIVRIIKCNPWHPGGHDPLPER